MSLTTLLKNLLWGQAVDYLNENFSKVWTELTKLNAKIVKNKGFFTTEEALIAAHPTPAIGDLAYVGTTYPGVVYDCVVAGTWHNTTTAPATDAIDLTPYQTIASAEADAILAYRELGACTTSTAPATYTAKDRVQYDFDAPVGNSVLTNFGALTISSVTTPSRYKIKWNGTAWSAVLQTVIPEGRIVQMVGQSTTALMSQKAVTDKMEGLELEVVELELEVHGLKYEDAFTITTTGDHSSNNDRITFPSPIPAGEYTFKVEPGTTENSGSAIFYVKYVGASTTTNIGGGALGTVITAELANPIESIGIYMSAATNQHTGSMPLTIELTADNIEKDIQQLNGDVITTNQKIEEYKAYLLNNRFIGKGSSYSSISLYGLKAGVKYRIELQDPSLLTDTSPDTTVSKFSVNYLKQNNTRGALARVAVGGGDVAAHYDFTMPNDLSENGDVEVGGRAVVGKVINFSIYTVQTWDYITYGVVRCTTAGATENKEVTIPGFAAANSERVRFIVYMTNPTTTFAKLVVNGGSAVNLYYNGARAGASNTWEANEYLDVIYNANYPAYFATTITNLKQSVNQKSPAKNNVVSEKGLYDYIEGGADKNVNYYNDDKVSAIVSAASRSPLVYEKTNGGLCPVFSILTDLHSDIDRFKRACAYADNVSEVLATLCLGDLIHHSNAQNPYPLILNYTKPVISITGNHEVLKSGTITGWSESDIMDNMYNSDQVEHNGETHPAGKCYWYKDFSKTIDGATKKLRVIGLHQYEGSGTGEQNTGSGKDVTFYTQDQIDWLIARLDEVDSNTWVMLLIHNAPTANLTRVECPFTPSDSFGFALPGGSKTGGPSSMSDDEFIPKIIQAWIDGTTLNISCDITVGETVTQVTAVKATAFAAHTQNFAGYFCGHTHRDFIGKLTNHPKQLQFTFICTSASGDQQGCDTGRNTTGKTQDCFTLVGIDWFKNSVNLIRIGADTTTDMRSRNYYNIPIPTA